MAFINKRNIDNSYIKKNSIKQMDVRNDTSRGTSSENIFTLSQLFY